MDRKQSDPLLVSNFKDSVRDHDHMMGKYHGAAHNDCMTEPENSTNTCLLSQLERLRWAPAEASDGEGAGRNKMHPNKHQEIHLILTGKSEICRQHEFSAEQPRQAGEGER